MKICCDSCHEILKDDDIVVIDILNGLCHYMCLGHDPALIKEIDTYQKIKERYDFFREDFI